ncbi:probable xyloglucan galactosyltransferase GT14 [Quercus robur]|uniref:probable xyloglucan galactosyltransferase GT14 n=1 Tax=Quercus robur TaxID=38942 RepID=UPI0021630B8B|nr:probable xyloglucan galactosyltransferase GT14 [Quercus robur]
MDSPIIGKRRIQFWFVVLASFFLWLFILYIFHSAPIVAKPGVILVGDNLANSVNFGDSNSVLLPGNSNESVDRLPNKGNFTSEETKDFVEPIKDTNVKDVAVKEKNATENWFKYKPFSNFSAGDYGLENFDHVVVSERQVHLNNQTDLAENEVQFVSQVPNSETNKEESDDEVAISQNGFEPTGSLSMVENRNESITKEPSNEDVDSESDSCLGRYIYVHDLPSRFNENLLKHCQSLTNWTDMCLFTSNGGLGPRLPNFNRVYSKTGWFATNQFLLEVIFHNRMKQYKCLTNDSSLASAIFVPYYAGLDVSRYLWYSNTSMRDAASLELVKWLREKPEWKKMWGRDHFLVAGRITWDFRRMGRNDSDWGNKLMLLPESRNMTVLIIESSPWDNIDFAIPYPTYFHPSNDNEVFQWQHRMRRQKRRFFFSFAGAPRPNLQDSIRNEIIDQCRASRKKCRLLECNGRVNRCYKPVYVMKMFQSSVFCLQPAGDSFTRRSTFDSILAGCIPVFFHPGSAYVQYLWHLPKDYTKYSVLIPANDVKNGKVSIEKILSRIPKEKVRAMREAVIRLIPKVTYADPRSRLVTVEDAFDVTVKGVLDRVEKIRREMREGKNSSFSYPEELSWKYNLFGTLGEHEWDPYFART